MKKIMNENRRRLALILTLFLLIALVGCTPESPPLDPPSTTPTEGVVGVPSDTPTPVPSISPTENPATNTPTPTEEVPSVTPTEKASPTATPTEEPVVTDTPTPEPTATETPVPTNTPTNVPTRVPDTPTPTTKPTQKPTAAPSEEPTKAPTNTPTKAPTPKPMATNTPTPTPEPTKAVEEKPYQMWVNREKADVFLLDDAWTVIGSLKRGDVVKILKTNVLNRVENWISEIEYNGGVAYVQYDLFSKNYVEPKWDEPRERKDLEEILMAKVNAYRESKGIRRVENPYIYYEVNNPFDSSASAGSKLGDYLTNGGLRVAKEQCLKQDAQHLGYQIGTGWYGPAIDKKQGGLTNEQLCEKLFQQWKSSPGHNANMLDYDTLGLDIYVGTMTVVEYYDGASWGYCAIMGHALVAREYLPDELR